jgi:hypothetical protein
MSARKGMKWLASWPGCNMFDRSMYSIAAFIAMIGGGYIGRICWYVCRHDMEELAGASHPCKQCYLVIFDDWGHLCLWCPVSFFTLPWMSCIYSCLAALYHTTHVWIYLTVVVLLKVLKARLVCLQGFSFSLGNIYSLRSIINVGDLIQV